MVEESFFFQILHIKNIAISIVTMAKIDKSSDLLFKHKMKNLKQTCTAKLFAVTSVGNISRSPFCEFPLNILSFLSKCSLVTIKQELN